MEQHQATGHHSEYERLNKHGDEHQHHNAHHNSHHDAAGHTTHQEVNEVDAEAHHHELEAEAHFTGPPEEDPVLPLIFCPFRTFSKQAVHSKENAEDHAYLHHVIEENEHDPSIVWFGLFTDLIFVAVIVKFADQFKYFYKYKRQNYSGANETEFVIRIVFESFLYFFAFFTVWMELCQSNTRFYNLASVLDEILYLFYLLGVITMALQMSATDYLLDHKEGFISGLLLCFVSIFFLHIAFHEMIPRAKRYAMRRLKTYIIAILVLAIALVITYVVPKEEKWVEWFCVFAIITACCLVMIISLISFRVDPRYDNWTLEYFDERFGILIMIVTGESILALIVGDKSSTYLANKEYATKYVYDDAGFCITDPLTAACYESEYSYYKYVKNSHDYYIYSEKGAFFQLGGMSDIEDYGGVFMAFATMYLIKNIYFESKAEPHEHALQEEGHPGSVIWVLTHCPLAYSLLCCGVGYKLLFTQIHYYPEEVTSGFRWILGLSLMVAIFCMLLVRAAHDRFVFPIISMIIRFPTAIAIPLGSFFLEGVLAYIGWCFGIVALSWVYDLFLMELYELKEEKDKHHDDHPKKVGGPCSTCVSVCGFNDKEFSGAYGGPKYEGDPIQLCVDVACCRICEEPAPAPKSFPRPYIKEISTSHGHGHGHGGHDEHGHDGKEDESGSDHGWFGEFTDLIFVSVIIKFADQMKYKQNTMLQADADLVTSDYDHFRVYIESVICFACFYVCWMELTHMLIRFKDMPGIFDNVMHFLFLCGVIGMAIQMNHLIYLFERRLSFSIWFAFALLCLVILHIKFYTINDAENYCLTRIVAFSTSACMALAGGFLNETWCGVLLSISCGISLWISTNSFRVWEQSKPDHTQHEYVERFGLIVMITMGESILALVIADGFEQELEYYLIVGLAFVMVFGLKEIYFQSHSEEPEMHALSEGNMPGSVCWALMHGPAAYFLLTMGVGFKMILGYAKEPVVDPVSRYTLGFSILGVIYSFIIIRSSHNKFVLPLASILIRFPIAALAPLGAVFINNHLHTSVGASWWFGFADSSMCFSSIV